MKQFLSLEPLDERTVPAVASTSSVVAEPEFTTSVAEVSRLNPEAESASFLPPGTIKIFNPQPEIPKVQSPSQPGR